MTHIPTVLAFDLGAGSGRAMIGELVETPSGGCKQLRMTEVHRFSNTPVRIGEHLHWNTLGLLQEIKTGISKAFQLGFKPESCAIDTWGVDFGLLDANGELLGLPYHYRDCQTEGLVEELSDKLGAERLFAESGLQFMPFNTLYQLYAMKKANSPKLDAAKTLLLTPDLLNYFLTGRMACEFTMATTTQLYNPGKKAWNKALMQELELPDSIFIDPVQPGTEIGALTEEISTELGVPRLKVMAAASHDTESAAAAVPFSSEAFAYLVCGTWSLLGTPMKQPLLHSEVLKQEFSNEGGAGGTFHLLKNIMGLWILQESKRIWEQEGQPLTYPQLVAEAKASEPFRSLIDPDDLRFMNPVSMPEEIVSYCRDTGQPEPRTIGETVRCILESLALRYRMVLEQAEQLTGAAFEGLHMVGGGIQNELLCRFTAGAIGRPVWTGPVEASAIGNMLVQLQAAGYLADMQEGVELVKASFPISTYEPEQQAEWQHAYARYQQLMEVTPC